MSPQSQQIAIAEACGWTDLKWIGQKGEKNLYGKPSVRPGGICVPDYTEDLNAMHEAEKVLGLMQRHHYANRVASSADAGWGFKALHATAAQRAEAFLRTIGKWEEGK